MVADTVPAVAVGFVRTGIYDHQPENSFSDLSSGCTPVILSRCVGTLENRTTELTGLVSNRTGVTDLFK